MKIVSMYQTSDGRMFESQNEAIEHEFIISATARLKALFAPLNWGEAPQDDVFQILIDNRETVMDILGHPEPQFRTCQECGDEGDDKYFPSGELDICKHCLE